MAAVDELTEAPKSTPGHVQYWELPALAAKAARLRKQPRWQQQLSSPTTKGADGTVDYWELPALAARRARIQQQPKWKQKLSKDSPSATWGEKLAPNRQQIEQQQQQQQQHPSQLKK